MPKLTLIRGIPGSGKSTLALKLQAQNAEIVIHEADQFFTSDDGTYRYDISMIEYAHKRCLGNAVYDLYRDKEVVVANTFTKDWEVELYLAGAVKLSVPVEIILCTNRFKNIHGVPEERVKIFEARMWSNDQLKLKYPDVVYTTI